MALNKILTDNKNAQLIQDNSDRALTPLQNAPLTGGALLKNLNLTSGQDNVIQHTLGYVPTISIAGIPNVSTSIWTTASDKTNITLKCSVTCTVSVWVK